MSQLPNTAKVSEIIASLQDSTAVNVRPDLAQRIGSPALGTDAMSTMLDKFDTIRTNMINDLKAKGYTLTGNESIAELEAIVKGANLVNTTTANGATAPQVLVGREGFANGAKVVGTMPNRATFGVSGGPGDGGPNGRHNSGAAPWVPVGGGWVYARVPQGYYPGVDEWVYLNDPDFVAANFPSTKNVFGLQGAIPVRDSTNGTMPGAGANHHPPFELSALGSGGVLFARPNAATDNVGILYRGDDWLRIEDADFTSANIRSGVNLFGLPGTLVEGKPFATGQITGNGGQNLIAGLAFAPVIGYYKQVGAASWGLVFFDKNWDVSRGLVIPTNGGTNQVEWDANNGLTSDGMKSNNIQMGTAYRWVCIGA